MSNRLDHASMAVQEVEGFDLEADGADGPGTIQQGDGDDGGASLGDMLEQFHQFEANEESKIPDGADGHEADFGEGVDAETEEEDRLLDGSEGSGTSEKGDGTRTEMQGYQELEEVEGFDGEQLEFGGEAFERVFGKDDRVRVGNTKPFPWRTLCKLEITAADGSRFGCSGAMIGPRTVLTNGHCVYMHSHGGWARRIRVVPGKNGTSEPYGSAVGTYYHSVKGWTKNRSSNYDYAVIVLPSNAKLGNRTGWMGLARLSFTSLLGLRVNTSGYPGDKPSGTQWWNANNVLAVTARRLFYRLDTFGGQSGSPVWRYRNGQRHIVAVHNTGGPAANGSVRLSKPVFDNLVKWKDKYK